MKKTKRRQHQSKTSQRADEYIERSFERVSTAQSIDFLRFNNLHDTEGERIRETVASFSIFIIRKGKRPNHLKVGEGVLTIKNQHPLDVSLHENYFKNGPESVNFFYEKKDGEFYPVNFVFEGNTIEGFDAQSLHERCEFRKNYVKGTVSGSFDSDGREKFFDENDLADGIVLSDCVFKNQSFEGEKIKKVINVTAKEKLSFKDCEIVETDFFFEKCPLVQFLGNTQIDKITNIYDVRPDVWLKGGNGMRDLYFSELVDLDPGDEYHTPEEKQYFFKQIKSFQEEKGDTIQALFAHQKYLQQELKRERLRWWEKLIIRVSGWFGSGLNWVKPLYILLASFSILSVITKSFNLSFLFPVFPYVMFAEIESAKALSGCPHLLKNLIFLIYYLFLVLSWYFIIKSLRKFTYKK